MPTLEQEEEFLALQRMQQQSSEQQMLQMQMPLQVQAPQMPIMNAPVMQNPMNDNRQLLEVERVKLQQELQLVDQRLRSDPVQDGAMPSPAPSPTLDPPPVSAPAGAGLPPQTTPSGDDSAVPGEEKSEEPKRGTQEKRKVWRTENRNAEEERKKPAAGEEQLELYL